MALNDRSDTDNSIRAEDRLIPQVSREPRLVLSGTTEGRKDLRAPVKSAVLEWVPDNGTHKCWFWTSILVDGVRKFDLLTATEVNRTNAQADDREKTLRPSRAFQEAQQREFGSIHAVAEGSGTLFIYPGAGVSATGVD